MMPRHLFVELGGFDERFFLYYEDNDLCLRIRNSGARIYLLPEAGAVHYCGQSLKSYDPIGMSEIQRTSLLKFYVKHNPVLGRLLCASITADGIVKTAAKRVLERFAGQGVGSVAIASRREGVELVWRRQPEAESYFLEITKDPCFIHKVGARVTENKYFLCHRAYHKLPDEVYFFRAAPMAGTRLAGRIQVGRFRKGELPI